jgi:hypothetical protein
VIELGVKFLADHGFLHPLLLGWLSITLPIYWDFIFTHSGTVIRVCAVFAWGNGSGRDCVYSPRDVRVCQR